MAIFFSFLLKNPIKKVTCIQSGKQFDKLLFLYNYRNHLFWTGSSQVEWVGVGPMHTQTGILPFTFLVTKYCVFQFFSNKWGPMCCQQGKSCPLWMFWESVFITQSTLCMLSKWIFFLMLSLLQLIQAHHLCGIVGKVLQANAICIKNSWKW